MGEESRGKKSGDRRRKRVRVRKIVWGKVRELSERGETVEETEVKEEEKK